MAVNVAFAVKPIEANRMFEEFDCWNEGWATICRRSD